MKFQGKLKCVRGLSFCLAVFVFGFAGLSACTKKSTDVVPAAGNKLQRAAPDFELEDADGKKVKLSSLKGMPAVLHFWASWCPPCIEELPQFLETAKEYEGKNIRWIAINLDKTWAEAHKILPVAKLPANVTSIIDPEQKTPDLLGSYQFPESYLLDAEHRIMEKWVGMQDWKGASVRSVIEQAMASAAAAPAVAK